MGVMDKFVYSGGAASSRSGDDGFIADDNRARAGNDGAIANDGSGRSGLDGQTSSSAGRSDTARYNNASLNLYAKEAGVVYGGNFTVDDIGRTVTSNPNYLSAGATIVDVVDNGTDNYAVMSHTGSGKLKSYVVTTWTTGSKLSNHYISNSANFTNADLNHIFQGTNIPNGTVIQSIVSTTEVILSNTPTAAGSGLSWTVVAQVNNHFSSAIAHFTNADLNHTIQGTNIPIGTTISSIIDINNITLSQPASNIGTGLAWNILGGPSTNFHSDSAAFITGDTGKTITGDDIAPNTTITFVDSKNVTLSQMPLASGANLNWSIQTAPQNSTKTISVVAANVDAKGKDFALITLTLATGVINITDPSSPNTDADAQTPCPF
jgi:hypothetical protein